MKEQILAEAEIDLATLDTPEREIIQWIHGNDFASRKAEVERRKQKEIERDKETKRRLVVDLACCVLTLALFLAIYCLTP